MMTCSKNKECEGLLLASATTQRDASRGTETSAGGQYSSCPLRKQKGGLLPRFLSVFLAFGSIMPLFLKTKFRCLPPPPSTTRASGLGTTRSTSSSTTRWTATPPSTTSTRATTARRTSGCSSRLLSDRAFCVRSRFFRAPGGGTPRFLNDFWLTSRQYFLMWRFLNAHEPL